MDGQSERETDTHPHTHTHITTYFNTIQNTRTCTLQEAVTLLEEEVVVDKLLALGLGHRAQRVVPEEVSE